MNRNYTVGYTPIRKTKVNITFIYYSSYFQPSITGPDYILTNDTAEFTLDSTDMIIEKITATNCTSNFDSTTNKLTITNPTNNVSVFIKAHGIPCIIYLGGSVSLGPNGTIKWATWVNKGTIKYTDVYGILRTVDISTLGLDASNRIKRIRDALVGSDVICTDVGIGLYDRTSSVGWPNPLTFSNIDSVYSSDYNYRAILQDANSTASYTFTNVQLCPRVNDADVRIDC